MQKPETPDDEELRLSTLNALNILDTAAEDRFDRLTRMARRAFDVPISLVSLVDKDRQWFKSCIGLDVQETARDISFCGHAILGDQIFIIEDASLDDRFKDNPLVMGSPHIRFYAGRPIRARNGSKLGTICVIDRKPRQFDEDDIQILNDLAAMVESEIAAMELAQLDELTGVSNRRGLNAIANQVINICKRQGTSASLVLFDLNNFKQINDNFGHAKGDTALIAFAAHLKELLRDSDMLARVGGDEFVVLLTNTAKSMAEEVVERFKVSLEKYNNKVDRGYTVSFSYGIVEFDAEKHDKIERWLTECDDLMYTRKQANR